jgi:outer membrane protein OmpA-like peptidoglycan-associated protein
MRRRASLAAISLLPFTLLAACAPATPPTAAPSQPVHVVFFQDDSAVVAGPALAVIQDAARAAGAAPAAPVRVLGFVAPEPGQAPWVALSRARADAVANELVRFGVNRQRIQVQGRGAATFAVDAPIEARRVEIHTGTN